MLLAQVYWYRDKLDRTQKEAEGQYPVHQHLSLKIVVSVRYSTGIQWRIQGEGPGGPDPPIRPDAYNFETEITSTG